VWKTAILSEKNGVAMARKTEQGKSPQQTGEALPPDLGLLLEEIEREPVPERLLMLAQKLQDLLAERRRRAETKRTSDTESRRERVKQPQ